MKDEVYVCVVTIDKSEVRTGPLSEVEGESFDEWYHDEERGRYFKFCRNYEDACLDLRAHAVRMIDSYAKTVKLMNETLIEMNQEQKHEAS